MKTTAERLVELRTYGTRQNPMGWMVDGDTVLGLLDDIDELIRERDELRGHLKCAMENVSQYTSYKLSEEYRSACRSVGVEP